MPWVQIDTALAVALIGAIGVVIGNIMTSWSQRRIEGERSRLAELTLAFDAMKEELGRLDAKVQRLEAEIERANNELDEMERRYRAALSWGRKTQHVLENVLLEQPEGARQPLIPEPPDLIRPDM